METKHTKGKWVCEPNDYNTFEYNVTSLHNGSLYVPTKIESTFNAKLISAAPELLEALIEVHQYLYIYPIEKIENILNEAIKKAIEYDGKTK